MRSVLAVIVVLRTILGVGGAAGTVTAAPSSPPSLWTIVASPGPPATYLYGISCPTPTSCMAVGYYDSVASAHFATLVERWDGTAWTVMASPNAPGPDTNSFLDGVTCSTAISCTAVGDSIGGADGDHALVERWDGRLWTIVPTPNFPYSARGASLESVSCTADNSCTAVGGTLDGPQHVAATTLVEHWDGAAWMVVPSPTPSGIDPFSKLAAVSCTSAASCMAVGESMDSSGNTQQAVTLVERWDGTSWTVVPSPNPSGARLSELFGVSCTAVACSAVGSFATGKTDVPPGVSTQTLVEQWDGTAWTIVASPDRAGANFSRLDAVSCTAPTNCTATGASGSSTVSANPVATLVEQWDGAAWTIVPSPNPSSPPTSSLNSVSCPLPGQCTAVGNGPLIERSVKAPIFTYPTDGQTNVDTTRPFTWSTTSPAQGYILAIGTALYGTDLVNSGVLPPSQSSFNVAALPAGETLHATLLTEVDGTWSYQAITFTAAPGQATFSFPLDAQTGVDPTRPFTWSPIAQSQGYILAVGTTKYGTDLVNSGVLPPTQSSYATPVLPAGRTLYATLLTKVNGAWTRFQAITFTTGPAMGTFSQPVNGQSGVVTPASFTWTTVAGAQNYYLAVGTALYGTNLVNTGPLAPSQSSFKVPALPHGQVLHATLLTKIDGNWVYQSIAFATG